MLLPPGFKTQAQFLAALMKEDTAQRQSSLRQSKDTLYEQGISKVYAFLRVKLSSPKMRKGLKDLYSLPGFGKEQRYILVDKYADLLMEKFPGLDPGTAISSASKVIDETIRELR
jgi:hypothetical protein